MVNKKLITLISALMFANCSFGQLSVTITDSTNINCNGLCDGTAEVLAVGGTPPYTYLWSNGDTTAIADSLCAGVIDTVIVIDALLAVDTTYVTLSEPLAISIDTELKTDITCNGLTDGTITITASGGTGALEDSITGFAYQPDGTPFTGLSAGLYTVTVKDANGCTQTGSTLIINEPAILTSSITDSTNLICGGVCDGTATVTPGGGTPPYTYSWSSGATPTDSANSGLCASVVDTVVVTDTNGCRDTTFVTLSEPLPLTSGITDSNNISCNGLCDGTAIVTPGGGTTPYTYAWSSGATPTDSANSGLCAGVLDTIIVTDTNGCRDTSYVTLSEPLPLTSDITDSNNISCNGLCDGTATVTPGGGTTPYTYAWSSGTTPADSANSGLCAGVMDTVVVTDTNGCQDTSYVTLSEPLPLTSSITDTTNLICAGVCGGTATVTPGGGTLPYTYLWNDTSSQTNDTAIGLCAGSYQVIVTDSNGCTDTSNVILTEPLPLTSGITDSSNISCYGLCDGWATVTPGGGILPYTYLWDDDSLQTNDTANGLCIGSYQVIVTDSNGCAVTSNVTLTEPTVLTSVIADSTDVSCLGICNGAATVVASGGTPPYAYLWPSTETTPIAGNLCAGNNTVTVTDANTCTSISSVSLTNVFPGPIASFTAPDVCLGDSILFTNTSTVSSGFIQLYIWNFGDGGSAPDTNPVYLYNNPGTYSVSLSVITDKNCVGTTTANITVNPLPVAGVTANGATAFCIGDSLELIADPAVSYIWLRDGDTIPGAVDSFYFATVSGDYQVMVTDSCGSDLSPIVAITVNPLPMANAGNDTTLSLGRSVVLNGEGGITYYWSPVIGLSDSTIVNPIATPLDSITYILTVTDINGCVDIDSVTVTIKADYDIIISNLMTPNGDGDNDAWYIDNIENYPECEVFVFNRYGFMLFNTSPYDNNWDGTYNGSKLPDGTYYYILKCDEMVFKGVITILGNE